MKKIVWAYGLISGVIMVVMFYITSALLTEEGCHYDRAMVIGYATMIVALSTIFFGVKTYRDKHLSGSISFGKAFLLGLYITLIATAIYVIGWKVFSHFHPHHMDGWAACEVESLKASGASPQEVANKKKEMDDMMAMMKNPLIEIPAVMMEIFPVGLLISLLCAAILRRQPKRAA
jgi:hypothetical protein